MHSKKTERKQKNLTTKTAANRGALFAAALVCGLSGGLHSSDERAVFSRGYGTPDNADFQGTLCEGVTLQKMGGQTFNAVLHKSGAGSRNLSNCGAAGAALTGRQTAVDDELYLDFDSGNARAFNDRTGHYRIIEADFNVRPGFYNNAGLFIRSGHKIALEAAPGSFFSSSENYLPSFTLSFWLKIDRPQNGEIISRISRSSGRRQGMRLVLENNRVVFYSHRLFKMSQGYSSGSITRDYTLAGGRQIKVKQWQHVVLAYNHISGKLAVLQDGLETASLYTTDTGRRDGSILRPRFEGIDAPAVIIGNGFYGYIDELRLTPRYLVDDNALQHAIQTTPYPAASIDYTSNRRRQKKGVIMSEVIKTTYSRASLATVSAGVKNPEGAHSYVELRYSDHPFDARDRSLPFKRIAFNDSLDIKGRYFQWRVSMMASPDGHHSPVLQNIRLQFREDMPPADPRNLRLVKELSTDGKICLEFSRSPEEDVNNGGGYLVYFGFQPGTYRGRIRWTLDKKGNLVNINNNSSLPLRKTERGWVAHSHLLTAEERKTVSGSPWLREKLRNRVRVLIDNNLIRRHMNQVPRDTMPFLETDTVYYFTVSAYDRQFAAGFNDHESAQSTEITGRSLRSAEVGALSGREERIPVRSAMP